VPPADLGGMLPGIREDSRPEENPAQNGEMTVDRPISVGAVVRNPEEAFRTSLGAGVCVAAEAEAGHATERTGSLAVSIPVAGFLLGIVLLMLATHHAIGPASIGSKLVGAAVIVALGALTPPALAVAGSAVVVVVLVTLMILDQFRRQGESAPP
jgi:hypothetical protein